LSGDGVHVAGSVIVKDILVIYIGDESAHAVEEALRTAKSESRRARVLQILDSDLYHYGHNDLVAPRLNKQRFLDYIRGQVLMRGDQEADLLARKARAMGVSLDISPVETDDLVSTVLAEAKKGYEIIFLAKEKKRIFPLLKKNLARELRKATAIRVVEC
jgi:hypothetical protein